MSSNQSVDWWTGVTKTLTLAQAQTMALIPGGGVKIIIQVASGSSAQKQILLKLLPVSVSKAVEAAASEDTSSPHGGFLSWCWWY